MPIFEFKCKKCGEKFEKIQLKSAPDPCCPSCGAASDRLISSFGFVGSGDGKSSAKIGHSCGSCSTHNCGSCSH
ncbi:MAG TPA: zinc ribbon domain-containing protein [Candidatus Wallbacteria bacterium]|nr:zinc ribbon domain-containing protein [Candidatus Wallbacteria bacterium]HPG59221.1 zinc ribbon domain-containing protein [Candidatus Wallbacteria bacterium]